MKKNAILITGAGGFLGNRLLEKLDTSNYHHIYCLTRRMEQVRIRHDAPENQNITVMEGNLLEPESYEHILKEVDTVVHMAAATGKTDPETYTQINAYATMLLLDRCKKQNVKKFLFISSIAVAFDNTFRYFYAHSKEQAENYVNNSGLQTTILRPTMIMGKGSPVFEGLAKLASLPVIPVFGDGKTRIQPIHVDDVARVIRAVLDGNQFQGETLEIGGPDVLTIEEFMKKTAQHLRRLKNPKAQKAPGALHLPIGLFVLGLTVMEHLVYGMLPLTVGQLASFRNDGTAKDNTLTLKMTSLMKNIDEIISDSADSADSADGTAPDAAAHIPPQLDHECRVFSKYLTNLAPNDYILNSYHNCHKKVNLEPVDRFDALLLKLASKGPLFTRMADAFSRFFCPTSLVRKKLAYLMAMLEVSPPYFRFYDSTDGAGLIGFAVRGAIKGMGMALCLAISVPLLLPLRIITPKTPIPASGSADTANSAKEV